MRRLSNCWIAAMWIWAAGMFRQYAWVRRSHSFGGMVPHFGAARSGRWKSLKVIEYIPPRGVLWTPKNKLLLFAGSYRVWHFRISKVRRHRTHREAMEDFQA